MISAPPAEKVDERFAIQSHWKLFPEAQLKFIDFQEAIFVIINIFDCTPDFGCLVSLFSHEWRNKFLINLNKSLQLKVILLLNLVLFYCNQVIHTLGSLSQTSRDQVFHVDNALTELYRIIFKIFVLFITLKDELHLLLVQGLVRILLQ